jgi:hypothetical protein
MIDSKIIDDMKNIVISNRSNLEPLIIEDLVLFDLNQSFLIDRILFNSIVYILTNYNSEKIIENYKEDIFIQLAILYHANKIAIGLNNDDKIEKSLKRFKIGRTIEGENKSFLDENIVKLFEKDKLDYYLQGYIKNWVICRG